MLYTIPQEIIEHVIFPLGVFENKDQIRKIAKEHKLVTASKADSQDICFIPDGDYGNFLEKQMGQQKEGNIVDLQGNNLGKHKGLIHHTIGQRKGLGISHKVPLFVIKLDTAKNELVVGESKDLFTTKLTAKDVNWLVSIEKIVENQDQYINVQAKIRYSAKPEPAKLYIGSDKTVTLEFSEAQRAVTPGQSAVFYIGDVLIGGGKIV